jgi:hypothetical protein
MYQRTKRIGGQNVSADKMYLRAKCIGRQNVSADKMYRRTKSIGISGHSHGQYKLKDF